MPPSPLAKLRKVCLSFREAHEVEAWGTATFRLDNHLFAMYAQAHDHPRYEHEAVWVKCTPINQSLMIGSNPKKFFSPPYVGPSGWIGVRLDIRVNWKELAGILRDGYDLIAAKRKQPATATRAKTQKLKRQRKAKRTTDSSSAHAGARAPGSE